jgi:hypothetical protein
MDNTEPRREEESRPCTALPKIDQRGVQQTERYVKLLNDEINCNDKGFCNPSVSIASSSTLGAGSYANFSHMTEKIDHQNFSNIGNESPE